MLDLIKIFIPLFVIMCSIVSAQDIEGGTVKYQITSKYTFEKTGKPEWDEYAKSLPTERKSDKVLYFTNSVSLFEDIKDVKPMTNIEKKAVYMANYGKSPKPKMVKLYIDIKENKKIEQLEFMTRNFIKETEVVKKNWKLTSELKKIIDYTCMSAEIISEKDTIIAWYTPQIPISTGPAEYLGLPGLVLAIEKNNETILLATSIDLVKPESEILIKPNTGKKVSQKELDKIVEEKIKEFENTKGQESKKNYYKK